MKTWLVKYTPDKDNYFETEVRALTYTMAIVQFMIMFPQCEYVDVVEYESEKTEKGIFERV